MKFSEIKLSGTYVIEIEKIEGKLLIIQTS